MSLSSNFETREELCAQQRAGEAEEVKYVLWEIFDAVEKSKGRNPHHTEPLFMHNLGGYTLTLGKHSSGP